MSMLLLTWHVVHAKCNHLETCGSGHVYPLALVSGSSRVRRQGAAVASAGKSRVKCSEAEDIHRCTHAHGHIQIPALQ